MSENKNEKPSFFSKGKKTAQRVAIRGGLTDRIKAVRLVITNEELASQHEAREKCADELIIANKEIASQYEKVEKCASELTLANEEIAYQSEEKDKLAAELDIANDELAHQSKEKEKQAAELVIANEELAYQSEEKEKLSAELIIANKELAYQSEEKEKRAAELIIADEELAYQSEEKEKRAAELVIANKELAYQSKEKEKTEHLLNKTNESLQKRVKELAVSNSELEQFVYVASHDLQEPLRMVNSFMTQLEKKYGDVVDDKGKQYIRFAVDGAKQMRRIIMDLLDFSNAGNEDETIEEVDFNKLMGEILAFYRRKIGESDADITFGNLPVIQTYRSSVRKVLQNLVDNSLKYHKADESPIISISCKETKTHFQFAIKDNGIGIEPEYFDKVFIIFKRLHGKDEYSGTGMGLAIAKKIIENLGGTMWVKSAANKGCTFYFTLLKDHQAVL